MSTTQTNAIIDRHDRFLCLNYARYPVALARGEGVAVWDAEGNEYLDLFAGFGAPVLGHCHPDLIDAVTEQAKRLWHVGNLFHTEPQTRAAEAIATHGFGGRSFFCHSGADANEAAIKLARLYGYHRKGPAGQRYKVISATRSFHGRSFGTMGATGNPKVREGFGPLPPGFVNVPYNDLDAIKQQLDEQTVAVIVEPIQGEGGIHVPEPDYFPSLRALCDEHDLLLIADEVWTGCGRTGRYFGYQHWKNLPPASGSGTSVPVEPDIMTLGKGVGGGLAVGVMCAKEHVAELYNARTQGGVKHASTLGGNCLAMAVTARLFEVLERDKLVDRAAQLGEHMARRLTELAVAMPAIRAVRGRGLFVGIELNPQAEDAWFDSAAQVVQRCLDQRMIVGSAQGEVLRLAPALVINQDQLDVGLNRLEQALRG